MSFLDKDFLLEGGTARTLFHDVADKQPIIDYHCHLSPKEIYENKAYSSIGQMMLGGDHYKWRAMRAYGAPESAITGDAGFCEKFRAFAGTLAYAQGNPLLHWTHLELQRVFGIDDALTAETADAIFDRAGAMLDRADLHPRGLIEKFDVKLVCTTDDPADDLAYHKELAKETLSFRVLPAFRPDKAVNIRKPEFAAYIRSLGSAAGFSIHGLSGLLEALSLRLDAFHAMGARVSDHGLDGFAFERTDADTARRIFREAMAGRAVSAQEALRFRSFLLVWLGEQYAARGWVQQYHLNALRNNSARMFAKLGPDTGFDSIGDTQVGEPMSRLLDSLAVKDALPKTILYSINPNDNYTLAAMCANFQGGQRGKMQLGSGWWFNDQRDGMEAQLRALGNNGLLGCFVGMLTDSRSFVSYTRHEYFRRIFCNLIGSWADNGELPGDEASLRKLVSDVSYHNAKEYFGMELPDESH